MQQNLILHLLRIRSIHSYYSEDEVCHGSRQTVHFTPTFMVLRGASKYDLIRQLECYIQVLGNNEPRLFGETSSIGYRGVHRPMKLRRPYLHDNGCLWNVCDIYSSTCHERTPSGPGKSVRSLQVAADQRYFNVELCRSRGIDNVAVQDRWPLTTGVA